jgi:4'-phosphopantetheinyl transferase
MPNFDTCYGQITNAYLIAPGAVHVWGVPLVATPAQLNELTECLAIDEMVAASRYVFAQHRDRFIAARANLRRILAGYLDQQPKELRFRYGACGKPALAAPDFTHKIAFNLSQSGSWALVAIAADFAVGIDIEQIRPDPATLRAIEQQFSPRERAVLSGIPAERRAAALFKGWTSKEAYIKGLGAGFSVSLAEFDVCVDPDRPARLLRAHPVADHRCSWCLHDVPPIPGYSAALATALVPAQIIGRIWQQDGAPG